MPNIGRRRNYEEPHQFILSERTLRHIRKRYGDWIRTLGLSNNEEIRRYIIQALIKPDEIYYDIERDDVRYFLRKINDKFLCIITIATKIATAYLISERKYEKYKERRWR